MTNPASHDRAERYGGGAFVGQLCAALGLAAEPELIRHNTNLIYDCGDLIVRLTPNSVRSREEVAKELHWMSFVASRTRDVVQVLGDDPTETRQFESGGEEFTITLLEKIEGEPVAQEQWGAGHFQRLGRLAGFLHRIAQEYRPRRGFDLTGWDEIPEASLARELPDDSRNLLKINDKVLNYMDSMARWPATYGPVHYDIHAGNYLMTPSGRMVLFDFENSCRGHYINDIAVALYYARIHKFSGGDRDFNRRFLAPFWVGYAEEYPVPEDEIEHIPWLLLNRSLIVYGYVLKIWPEGSRDAAEQEHVDRIERSVRHLREEVAV